MLGIPSKEIKATLENADRMMAEAERTMQHAQAALVTLTAILEDARALSAALRQKLLEGK
jgi:multidrug resistance efflux pump